MKPAPVMQSSFKEKHVPLYKDKNCQATICEYDDSKVNLQWKCVLTRTVKKLSICGQWPIQMICGYPNQQYHMGTKDYARTRNVNLQDVTKKSPVRPVYNYGKNCQSDNNMCYTKWNLNLRELMKTSGMQSVPELIVNRLGHSLK